MNNEKLLESYVATSGYTIRALEAAIKDLKAATTETNRELIPIFQERVDELENHLAVITLAD